ncbi:hypothetical protein DFH11DRAFT_1549963 [Phellopilus nigrolimitatus]|nr:hypothetical protein DFH11DRAFT_1551838 [Phellopilus nigrolimitatus]KAH8106483.1 hypothetical protein DFH11DRAFT_1549963 [Phellopilus nigrolimitatus]
MPRRREKKTILNIFRMAFSFTWATPEQRIWLRGHYPAFHRAACLQKKGPFFRRLFEQWFYDYPDRLPTDDELCAVDYSIDLAASRINLNQRRKIRFYYAWCMTQCYIY